MGERNHYSSAIDGLPVLHNPTFQQDVNTANRALAVVAEVAKRGEHLPPDRNPENIVTQHIIPHVPDGYIGSPVTITNVTKGDRLTVCQLRGELLPPAAEICMVNKRLRLLAALAIRSERQRYRFPLSQETIGNILQFDIYPPVDLLAKYFTAQATHSEIYETILDIEKVAKYAISPADRAAIIARGVQQVTQQLGEDFCTRGSFSGEGFVSTNREAGLTYCKFNDLKSSGFSVVTDPTDAASTPRVALSLENGDNIIHVIPDRRFLARLTRQSLNDIEDLAA